jgi:hypothetical protein
MMNGNGQAPQPVQQQTYDGNIQVPITLNLATWTAVLNLVAEAPWKTADPLLKAMNEQIRQVLEGGQQPQAPLGDPNISTMK